MRSVSDRGLPEPYRTWIDRSDPLPAGVRLLPRTVEVGTDVVTFLGVGGMFGGMAVLMFVLLRPWRLDPLRDGWAPILIMGGLLLALGMGLASGLVPAFQAGRLKIANALRKVA